MIISDLVARNARQCPDHIAFVEVRPVSRGRKETTWARFDERTNRLANALMEREIGKGQKVAPSWKELHPVAEAFFRS
jgi:acyl-CoA synthetase (AMP-forming)/AMP-acid ligase II